MELVGLAGLHLGTCDLVQLLFTLFHGTVSSIDFLLETVQMVLVCTNFPLARPLTGTRFPVCCASTEESTHRVIRGAVVAISPRDPSAEDGLIRLLRMCLDRMPWRQNLTGPEWMVVRVLFLLRIKGYRSDGLLLLGLSLRS